MDRQTRVAWYLAGWLFVTLSGCASWPVNAFRTAAKGPPAYESSLSLARLSERHGEPSTAEKLYQAVLVKDPQHQVAHHRLAVLATRKQQFDQAQHHFDQALAGTPDSPLLSDWGYFLYLMDRLPEAEASLRESLQLDSGNISAHNNLGLVLGTMGRLDESLAEFRSAGNEAAAHANLAYVHSLNGAFDQSEAEYHQALKLDSQLKPAAEALLALHARNNASTAAAMAYTPTIPAHAVKSPRAFGGERVPMAGSPTEMASLNPATGQADRTLPEVATASYSHENHSRQLVSRAAAAVETNRPLMNLPRVAGSAENTESANGETAAVRQDAQYGSSPMDSAPMSIQSSQPQPWQTPSWTAQ